jgi:tetratricopeptide (TPR) repeat protein
MRSQLTTAASRTRATIIATLLVVSLAVLPGRVSATPGAQFVVPMALQRASDPDADLDPDALTHLRRGATYYERGEYSRAEVEFARVAHLEPDWQPIRYNLAATAEAQGKLDRAITEYQAFLPQADERQQYALALRIDELERRRVDALADHRRKMATNWGLLAAGIVLTGGATAMIAVGAARRESLSTGQFATLITVGSVMALFGLPTLIGAPRRIVKDRKALENMRSLSLTPTGSRHGAGATITGRF